MLLLCQAGAGDSGLAIMRSTLRTEVTYCSSMRTEQYTRSEVTL